MSPILGKYYPPWIELSSPKQQRPKKKVDNRRIIFSPSRIILSENPVWNKTLHQSSSWQVLSSLDRIILSNKAQRKKDVLLLSISQLKMASNLFWPLLLLFLASIILPG